MESEKDTTEISPQKISIHLPDGTGWSTDDAGDIGEFIDKAIEFIKSPEFLSSILPALSEQFVRRHKETMEKLALERQKIAQAGKYELQFLIGRLIMGQHLLGQ